MILLLSFLVCAKLLHCYIAVYNSPLLAAKLANHYFFAWAGWYSTLNHIHGVWAVTETLANVLSMNIV